MSEVHSEAEILRVWLDDDEPRFTLQPAFTDPGVWGVLFADIARLLGEAYAENGHDRLAATQRIRTAFTAEFESPTS
jgi:hypothetical protein